MTSVGFGATNTGGFAEALIYGADNGARISSNSWGYTSAGVYDQSVLDAIDCERVAREAAEEAAAALAEATQEAPVAAAATRKEITGRT